MRIKYHKLFHISKILIGKRIWKEKTDIKCEICEKNIEEGDSVVIIPTASFYANYKDFVVFHEGCFLAELQNLFKDEIKLTEKGLKLATIYRL